MANPHTSNAQRIVDVNGRLTTVYKRPDGNTLSPNRLTKVIKSSVSHIPARELNSYAGDNYVSIMGVQNESDLNNKIENAANDESCLFMVSDSTLDENDAIDIYGKSNAVLIHLDSLKSAKINIKSGNVVIKTYSDYHIPKITVSGNGNATVIISGETGADVTMEDEATATVVPESGAFGTIYVNSTHSVELSDDGVKHQMLVLG